MPGSRTSEESLRAASGLSVHHPTSFSTAPSSRATSPLPTQRSDPQRTISPGPSRATSPTPKSKRRPSVSRHHTTNATFPQPQPQPQMDGLLARVMAEDDKYINRQQAQINELVNEVKLRTQMLEEAYNRVETAEKCNVELLSKSKAERAKARNESKRLLTENTKAQMYIEVLNNELERVKGDVSRLEAEKAKAESIAGRAQAEARELKQSMRVDKPRDFRVPEGRGSDDRAREREYELAMAAAVKDAYERGKAEGEASATMKALAAFDKLMENDELNEWDDNAKMTTRSEIQDLSKKPSVERAKSPQPKGGKWGFRRGSSSNGD